MALPGAAIEGGGCCDGATGRTLGGTGRMVAPGAAGDAC